MLICINFLQIHKQMSLDEIRHTFHVDNHDLGKLMNEQIDRINTISRHFVNAIKNCLVERA